MNEPTNWRDLIVALDDRHLDTLASAAAATIESLRGTPDAPRSSLSPMALRDLVRAVVICPDEGDDLTAVLADFATTVWRHGVVPSDVACVAHLHPPTLVPAVAAELAIAATNQSMDSWDQAPAATEVELHLMGWLADLIGFGPSASGVMTSGGTASNLLGITLARSAAAARSGLDVAQSGLPAEASGWRILCSDQAHFSVQRAAAQLGLGRDAVVAVASTPSGSIDVAALDAAIERLTLAGARVIALVATAGTTDLGAIDPLDEVAMRARRLGCWFHVDAAVAGAFLLADKLRDQLAGIELADSVTIDFHKLWFQPFNASALVVRDASHFDLLRVRSDYLDRGDELEGVVNLVGRSLDTSRRFDAAKVIVTLRTLGRRALAEMLEHLVDLAAHAARAINDEPTLSLLAAPTAMMCVFDAPGATADDLREVQLRLLARGEMVLGRTRIKGRAALKFTFMNPLATAADVDRLVRVVADELVAVRAD
ncbi:MAG: pyridoxal phosphate-dependent decarboxylase family protein [Acidimicrobiales bacterium]